MYERGEIVIFTAPGLPGYPYYQSGVVGSIIGRLAGSYWWVDIDGQKAIWRGEEFKLYKPEIIWEV